MSSENRNHRRGLTAVAVGAMVAIVFGITLPANSPLTGIALLAKLGHEVIGLPYSWLFDRC